MHNLGALGFGFVILASAITNQPAIGFFAAIGCLALILGEYYE